MPRTARDARLETRTARTRLAARREPYWRSLSEGVAIGYRRGAKGGTWIARHYGAETGRRYQALGTTDDVLDANGIDILSFSQAQEAARRWFGELARRDAGGVEAGSYTVAKAVEDYIADYTRRGGKALDRVRYTADVHILPTLGSLEVAALTRKRIETWFEKVATEPARIRTRKGSEQRYRSSGTDPEEVRRRRSTANRILTVLKAALNFSHRNRRVANAEAWEGVRPFREVDEPKVRYLSDEEARRLVQAAPADLRLLISAALLTGCRYGELAQVRAGDFNPISRTIHIRRSKEGKAKHVALTDEGTSLFGGAIAGKAPGDLIFRRASGGPWKHADQIRPIREASLAAEIDPPVNFHILRHTYCSRLAMRGVPMAVIAAQVGHADTRMTERHYAHLAPNYVAETVRASFEAMGIVPLSEQKARELG